MRVEIRADHVLIDGYVNAVGRDSDVIPDRRGGFIEQVVPGAFGRALRRGNAVELKLNHERTLGSTATGVLELFEDNIGLRAKAKISDEAVIKKARDKALRGWSFGFRKPDDRWEERDKDPPRRYLEDFELQEVTIVDDTRQPAYPATSIELRGDEASLTEYRESDDKPEYTDIDVAPPGAEETHGDVKTSLARYRARRLKLS